MEELRLFSSTNPVGRGDRHDIRRYLARFIFINQKFQPVHLSSPGGADLYGARKLSQNEK